LKGGQKASIFYFDEAKKVWVEVGGVVNGDHIIVEVNHFKKYAVFAVMTGFCDFVTLGIGKPCNIG
jgi:tripartite motif-containing protein 71